MRRALLLFASLTISFSAIASAVDVWIGQRTDGITGNGKRADPFDGSTAAKLDALLAKIPPRTHLHFGAGTFLTIGIHVKEGWRISGLGKDRTTLRLSDAALVADTPGHERCVVFQFDFQGFLRRFEMSHLTIDCNRARQPAFQQNLKGYALDAWVIAAKSATITSVRSLGTWANPGEGFPCRVYHDGSRDRRDRVEIYDCENLNSLGYLTAISVFDQGGGLISGSIRHCRATGNLEGSGFGAGGWRNFTVADNLTRDMRNGLTIDTHDYRHVEICRNRFLGCGDAGVLFNGSGIYRDIEIHDNVIVMAPNATGPSLISGNANVTWEIFRNKVFRRNVAIPIFSRGRHTRATMHGNVVRRLTTLPNH